MAIYCVFDYRQCIGMNDIKYFYCKTNYPETNFNSFTHLLLNGTPVHLGPGERIATRYELDGPGIESRWGRDFCHPIRPALRPTQPPVQWIPGHSRG